MIFLKKRRLEEYKPSIFNSLEFKPKIENICIIKSKFIIILK